MHYQQETQTPLCKTSLNEWHYQPRTGKRAQPAARLHLPKPEKWPLLWSGIWKTLSAYQVEEKCERWHIFHSERPIQIEWSFYICFITCLGAAMLPLPRTSFSAAMLYLTWVRLMVSWSQAANFSLSRNNPLLWQMRRIWRFVHII